MVTVRKWVLILMKDLQVEIRRKDFGMAMVGLGVVAVVLFRITLGAVHRLDPGLASSILWIDCAYVGTLTVTRIYAREVPEDAIVGLSLMPGGRTVIFVAKVSLAFVFLQCNQVVVLALLGHGLLLQALLRAVSFELILGLGGVGLASVGTFVSAVSYNAAYDDVVLPLLAAVLPLPVLICAAQATTDLWLGRHMGIWLHGLVAYDGVFLLLPIALYELLWEV
jgi:heme exporter protein B